MRSLIRLSLVATACAVAGNAAVAQETEDESQALAKALANPVSSLVSVPIQFNYDGGLGPDDGDRLTVNVQPVIPFDIGGGASLVTRTIVPVIWQEDVAPGSGTQFGLGDTLQSFFYVPPPQTTALGTLTWGAGAAVTWPTSTDERLGLGTLGLGPTGVFLFQEGPWTWGLLSGHQWGVAETRDDVPTLNNTFFQPFLAYTTPTAWTFSSNIEGAYNWESDAFSVPINVAVSKLTSIGGQRLQIQLGGRYWAESPDNGPEGFGARLGFTFLFPK